MKIKQQNEQIFNYLLTVQNILQAIMCVSENYSPCKKNNKFCASNVLNFDAI